METPNKLNLKLNKNYAFGISFFHFGAFNNIGEQVSYPKTYVKKLLKNSNHNLIVLDMYSPEDFSNREFEVIFKRT